MSLHFVAYLFLSIVVIGRASEEEPIHKVCAPNSELKQCGSLCEPTCTKATKILCNPKDPDSCEQECRCNDGWVRNEDTDECVKYSKCPKSKTTTTEKPTPNCSCNETLDLCGTICEPTCANKNPNKRFCPRIQCSKDTENCRCKIGYYRNKSNECVLAKDCPRTICQSKGCPCDLESGYVRDKDTDECVLSKIDSDETSEE